MRCPDCSKFVAYDTESEPEANLEVSSEGMLSGDVRRVLPCGECGTELKSTTFDLDKDLGDVLTINDNDDDRKAFCPDGSEHSWAWSETEPSVSPTERLNDKDKNGKQIKQARFMTKYYGIEISGEVQCSKCGVKAAYSLEEEASAGSFDEEV